MDTMTLTLDNGQVLELLSINASSFSRYELLEPAVRGMNGQVTGFRLGAESVLVIYPAITIAGRRYAYKLKE